MNFRTRGWRRRPPLKQARRALVAANADGRVYAVGGFFTSDEPFFDNVEARSEKGKGFWRELPSIPVARSNCVAATIGDRPYVVGGLAEVGGVFEVIDSVHRFNPDKRRWEERRSLPRPRGFGGAAAFGGRLYVVGGEDNRGLSQSVDAYDPQSNEWIAGVTELPGPGRKLLGVVATERYIFAIGGFADQDLKEPLKSVQRYDPVANKWQGVAPLNQRRGNFGAAAFGAGRYILVVGGVDVSSSGRRKLRTSEVYDVETDEWHVLDKKLPVARANLACALESRDTVLAIGGIVPVDGVDVATDLVQAIRIVGRPENLDGKSSNSPQLESETFVQPIRPRRPE
jgi:N-acetylneuraminic acid mutarotase